MCSFNLMGMMDAAKEEKVLGDMIDKFPERTRIESEIASIKSSTKREQIEKFEEISFNNKSVPLKTEKLKMIFKKVETVL